ncbi:MAG: hypothetical protein PHT12_04585 [Patescibacteria group bacterium]|nr:hypothetical protein [Patescibacteria group bacterium]
MKYSKYALIMSAVGLTLVGFGCRETGDQIGTAVVQPIAAPVAALNYAKTTLSDTQAKANEQAESVANEMTVAMVLTDGTEAPAEAVIGETFGCNDRVAFTKAPRMTESGNVLQDALTSLLAVRESTFKGFYNALSQSSLSVEKIQSTDGVTTEVWLKGQIQSAGACDDPRIKKQIEATVERLKPKYKIFLNGTEENWRCIGDMSGQCK